MSKTSTKNTGNVQSKLVNAEMFVPKMAKIKKIETFTEKEKFFEISLVDGSDLNHTPGQFVELSVFGIGEAPISISSPPTKKGAFDLCIRNAGTVTNKVHQMKEGDMVGIRGPFGTGYDIKKFEGKNILFVAGGLGYAPLRSFMNYVVEKHRDFKEIHILYGTRDPNFVLYKDEIAALENNKDINFHITVDQTAAGWTKNVGVITTLFPKIKIDDPENTIAAVCGPPIMYKFAVMEILGKKIPAENIYMSLERRMKCGVGKCGHCQINSIYVCCEGPVFNYARIRDFKEAI